MSTESKNATMPKNASSVHHKFFAPDKKNLRRSKIKWVPQRSKHSSKVASPGIAVALRFLRHALCLNPVAKTRKSSKVYIDVMALLLHTFSNPRFLWFFACIILSLFRSDTYRFTQFRFYFQLYMYTLLRYKAKNLVFTCSADREWFLPFSALCCGPKCIQCLRKGVEKRVACRFIYGYHR